jgi:hypothetical protein
LVEDRHILAIQRTKHRFDVLMRVHPFLFGFEQKGLGGSRSGDCSMRSFLSAGLVGSMLALSATVPASAFTVDSSPKMATSDIVQVQFHGRGGGGGHRFHGGGFRGGGFHGGGFHGGGFHGGGFRGGRYYGGGYGSGAAIGAGVAGLAAGALIGGAIANSQEPAYYGGPAPVYADPGDGGDAEAYCAQRYRSYDPGSGTFLGNDGLRHPCP